MILITLLLLVGCSDEFEGFDDVSGDVSLMLEDANDPDFILERDIDSIIPIKCDSLSEIYKLMSRKKNKAISLNNDIVNSLYDLRDLPVNILVGENTGGQYFTAKRKRYKKWFKYHYSSSPAIFTTKQDDDKTTSQTFYLTYVSSGVIGIKTLFNGETHYMSPGAYSSTPHDYFLYASSDGLSHENSYDFKFDDDGYYQIESVLVGTDDPDNPTTTNVWNYILESKDSQSHLDKNRKLGTQKFTVVPIETFKIERVEYHLDETAMASPMPDFVVTWSTTNRTSVAQQMSTNFSSTATETSSFSNTAGVSVTVSGSLKVKIPLLVDSSIQLSTSSSYSRTWGESESTSDSRNYNFQIIVPAFSRVVASAQVAMSKLQVGYTTYLKGITTGREIRISGIWEGIECGMINSSYTQYDLDSNEAIGTKSFIGVPTQIVSLE